MSVVAPVRFNVVKSELLVIDIPAAFVIVPPIVAVTRLPLELRVTVSNVPAVVTVVKSPWFARLTTGPLVSAVAVS